MSSNSSRIIQLILITGGIFFGQTATADRGLSRHFYAVLDASVAASRGGEYQTMDRLFELRDDSPNYRAELIALLDYYLGAGGSETLAEFITREGREMLPLLRKSLKIGSNCLPEYANICLTEIEVRNLDIQEMIDAIERGETLCPDLECK